MSGTARWLLLAALSTTALLVGGGVVLMVASLPLPVRLMDHSAAAFRQPSTGASTAPGTTRSARLTRSAHGSATRSTWPD